MNRRNTSAIVLAIIAMSLLTSCSADPTTRWAQARDSLTAATVTATTAAQVGLLSDDQIITIDVAIKAARRALEVAESQLPDGAGSFDSYLDLVEAVLLTIAELTQRE